MQLNKIIFALFSFGAPIIGSLTIASQNALAVPMQSPVDINSTDTEFTVLPAITISYSSNTNVQVLNTGSPDPDTSIRVIPPAGNTVELDGVSYALQQFHFHSESEHSVNGNPYDMELHFVNQAADNSILVLGLFIELGADNVLLDPIFNALPQTSGATNNLSNFDIADLIPANQESFRYDGSLTTPPFTEGVKWDVFATPITMSAAQIDAFRALFPGGNEREEQDLNGRTILTDVPGFAAEVPEPASVFLVSVGALLMVVGTRLRRKRAA